MTHNIIHESYNMSHVINMTLCTNNNKRGKYILSKENNNFIFYRMFLLLCRLRHIQYCLSCQPDLQFP